MSSSSDHELCVVIPWRGRPELARTLTENSPSFIAMGAEVLVSSCGGDADWLRASIEALDPRPRVTLAAFEHDHFNKSLALNVGVNQTSARWIFFLDADIVLEPQTLADLFAARNEKNYVTISAVTEEPAEPAPGGSLREFARVLEFLDARGQVVRIETNRVRFDEGTRAAPGLVLLSRDAFLLVEGMNSEMVGWGWEDLDLLARLEFAAGLSRNEVGAARHLTHSDDLRALFGDTRSDHEFMNFAIAFNNYRAGNHLGSLSADVERAHLTTTVERL